MEPNQTAKPGAHEYFSAAMLAASLFLFLAGYYLLKTVREALILTEGGAEIKSYAAAGQAVILLMVLPVFGWIADRMKGFRLVGSVYLFFVANLVTFYLLRRAGIGIAVEFYLWLGVFSVVGIAIFWSYSNDLFTEAQGRYLFPFIGIGASLGSFLGAMLAKKLTKLFEVHTSLLAGALLVLAALALLGTVKRTLAAKTQMPAPVKSEPTGVGGFGLVASSRYLMLIAAVVVLTQVVNSTGEYIIGKSVVEASKLQAAGTQKQFIAAFYADYYTLVGLAGLLLQTLFVAPIFRKLGAGGSLLVLPVVAMGGYFAMAVLPLMWVMRAAKIAENSIDYSLQNTARHGLFLPESQEVKYKAKATIDSFFYRFGDLLQAGLVMLGNWLTFTISDFATMNIFSAGLLLGAAVLTAREYRKKTAPAPVPLRVPCPPRMRPCLQPGRVAA